jgi:hypothetical protein
MTSPPNFTLSRTEASLLNNLFEIERKAVLAGNPNNILRNIEKMKDAFLEIKFFYEDPTGQSFNETRTDVEATITGQSSENLVIVEVIKPIIRVGQQDRSLVLQKGIVIAASKDKGENQ